MFCCFGVRGQELCGKKEEMTTKTEAMKLVYFRARGECDKIRLLLAISRLPFEEITLSGEEFGLLEPEIDFGLLPVLGLFFFFSSCFLSFT